MDYSWHPPPLSTFSFYLANRRPWRYPSDHIAAHHRDQDLAKGWCVMYYPRSWWPMGQYRSVYPIETWWGLKKDGSIMGEGTVSLAWYSHWKIVGRISQRNEFQKCKVLKCHKLSAKIPQKAAKLQGTAWCMPLSQMLSRRSCCSILKSLV